MYLQCVHSKFDHFCSKNIDVKVKIASAIIVDNSFNKSRYRKLDLTVFMQGVHLKYLLNGANLQRIHSGLQ